MNQYCGIDLGKKSSHFHIVDGERKTVTSGKLKNNVEALRRLFACREQMRIVIEASCKAFWMADRLKELGHEVIVVDPGRTKAVGAARIKHDRLDARILAELCQSGLLAAIDIPTQEQRLARLPFTARDALVLKRWAAKLAERIGRKKAKSAIARKLATVLWAVWRRRTPFEARLCLPQPAKQVP